MPGFNKSAVFHGGFHLIPITNMVVSRVLLLCGGAAALLWPHATPDRTLFERLQEPQLVTTSAAQAMPVIRLPGFLSEAEQEELHALARSVREEAPHSASVWATDALELGEHEEWRTTFLNQRLPQRLPQLWGRVLDAARKADSRHFGGMLERLPQPLHALNVRSAEYHVITTGGALAYPEHLDYGSLVTVDFMLSSVRLDRLG